MQARFSAGLKACEGLQDSVVKLLFVRSIRGLPIFSRDPYYESLA